MIVPRINARGLAFAKAFEGFIACARDIGDGVLTIGYGTTSGSGRAIHRGDCISEPKAEDWLREDLNKRYIPAIPRRFRMKAQEVAALGSFAYNLGPGAVSDTSRSTLARRLKGKEGRTFQGRCHIYREEMPKWISKGTPFEAGLRKRRAAEVAMAVNGDYSGRP